MKKYSKYHFSALLLMLATGLATVSCADEDIAKDQENNGKSNFSFSVTDVQDAPDADLPSRATDAETYLTHSIDFNEAGTADMCLQESTIPGVNPMKRTPQTRAWLKASIDANFGAFACKNGSAGPDFFYNEEVNRHGQMVNPISWSRSASTLKFYAVYPYMDGTNTRQKLVQATTGSLPYVEFEASTDIANQTDLMTAETATLNYTATGGSPHVVPLKFYHALTAIRFGIGSNLSWNKTIKSIEFQGIKNAGRFDLATKAWSNQSGTQNFKLDNLSQSTSGTLNTVIVKDGNTFLMVPQTLPAGAKIVITFTDNSHITANIGGKIWAPGTTKTYMMTEKNSSWDYKLETTSPADIAYNQPNAYFTITSYRKDATTNTFQPVKWKIISYSESTDNGTTWSPETQNKPDWLTGLNSESGNGGMYGEYGQATIKTEDIDLMEAYNKVLKNAPEKGSAGNYYNLANQTDGGATIQNTANSYLISAPGYYRIPLVYGNAIHTTPASPTVGVDNQSAYVSSAPPRINGYLGGDLVLHRFKDHNEAEITSPYINVQNATDPATKASIVWADQSGLVENLSVTGSGDQTFVNFHVPAANIKNGNAVIAVKNASGTVMWSWHLWVDHADALDVIPCTNYQGYVYKFTKRDLGCVVKGHGTPYTQPRKVRLKVEQVAGQGSGKKTSYVTITQNPYSVKNTYVTLYHFGRKDAMPGNITIAEGSSTPYIGFMTIKQAIQNPDKWFPVRTGSYNHIENFVYCNLWSMNNNTWTANDNPVIKTIYDPCPPGFHIPASNAFTGFTKTGQYVAPENSSQYNVSGGWDNGWHFYNKLNNPDATIYFPYIPYRDHFGVFKSGQSIWWAAIPYGSWAFGLRLDYGINPTGGRDLLGSCFVRPVADE